MKRCSSRKRSNGGVGHHRRFVQVLGSDRSNGSKISFILMFGLSQLNEGTTSMLDSLRLVRSCNIGLVYIRSKVSDSGRTSGLLVSVVTTMTRVRQRGVEIRAVTKHRRGTERNG